MKNVDPEAEQKRLEQLYSRMSEEELEKLALDTAILTDIAKGALRAEVARRGLKLHPHDLAVRGERAQTPRVVNLRRFRDIPAALLAKSILDSAGIECFLADENAIRMDWLWSNALGGIKLQVRGDDAPAALELLNQEIPENLDAEGEEEK